jgi:predicted MPP superfamily phosphohydrolase
MGTWMNHERLSGIVEMVNDQRADLVAITGDFVSYTLQRPLQELGGLLKHIQSGQGCFAVLGNHDVWADAQAVRRMLDQCGIRELRNQAQTLRRESASLHICGVDNAYAGLADLAPITQNLPKQGAAILLAHEPDFADHAAASGRFDLQLSGHSHGGQLDLPFIGIPYLPHLAKKYPRGWYRVGNMRLYTSRGLGTTALQVRFRCPPEIAVIQLRACPAGSLP